MAEHTPSPTRPKRGRPRVLVTELEKERNAFRCKQYRQRLVNLSYEAQRWRELKTVVGEDNDAAFARILLDMLEVSLGRKNKISKDNMSQRWSTPGAMAQTSVGLEQNIVLRSATDPGSSDEQEAGQLVDSTIGLEPLQDSAEDSEISCNHSNAAQEPEFEDKKEAIIIQPVQESESHSILNIELTIDEIRVKEEVQTSEVDGDLELSKEKVNEEEEREEEELEIEEEKEEEEKCDDPSWFPGSSWKAKRNKDAFATAHGDPKGSMKRTRSRRVCTLKKQKRSPTFKVGPEGNKKQNKCKEQHSPREESTEEMVESNIPLLQEPKRNVEMEIFPCNFCEETFDEYQPMVGHSLSCHGDQEVKKCSFCGYEWKELIEDRVQEVANHLAEAHGLRKLVNQEGNKLDKYVCPQCTFMCTIPSLFVFHVEDQHEKTMFSCVKCPYKVIHRYQIHLHLERQHEWDRSSPVCEHIKVMKAVGKNRSYYWDNVKCSICGTLIRRGNIHTHVKTTHIAEVEGQEFKCQDCSRRFSTYRKLSYHWRRTHDKVKCGICQKAPGDKAMVRRHIERAHLGVRHYRCVICDLYMYDRASFIEHISVVHEGIRLYLCESCGKEFKTSHALEVHTRIHTGEKPLKCEFCEYSCRQRNALNWHMKKHKDKVAGKDKIPTPLKFCPLDSKIGRRPKQRSNESNRKLKGEERKGGEA